MLEIMFRFYAGTSGTHSGLCLLLSYLLNCSYVLSHIHVYVSYLSLCYLILSHLVSLIRAA